MNAASFFSSGQSNRKHSGDERFKAPLEQLVRNANPSRMLRGRERVLDHILDIQVGPDLVQVLAQVDNADVGEHDKLHARGGFVVMELVFAGAVGEKGVVGAAELGDEITQREDEAEDKLLVIVVGKRLAGGGAGGAVVGAGGGAGARQGWGGRGASGGFGAGGGRGRGPTARVDAFGWGGSGRSAGDGEEEVARKGWPGQRTVAIEDVEAVEDHGGRGRCCRMARVRVRVGGGGSSGRWVKEARYPVHGGGILRR